MWECPKGTSHDVIGITEDITLDEPLPPITGTITIERGGHTISGDGKFRIFQVDGGNLTINNLTMTDGCSDDTGGAIDIGEGDEVSAANLGECEPGSMHDHFGSAIEWGGHAGWDCGDDAFASNGKVYKD